MVATMMLDYSAQGDPYLMAPQVLSRRPPDNGMGRPHDPAELEAAKGLQDIGADRPEGDERQDGQGHDARRVRHRLEYHPFTPPQQQYVPLSMGGVAGASAAGWVQPGHDAQWHHSAMYRARWPAHPSPMSMGPIAYHIPGGCHGAPMSSMPLMPHTMNPMVHPMMHAIPPPPTYHLEAKGATYAERTSLVYAPPSYAPVHPSHAPMPPSAAMSHHHPPGWAPGAMRGPLPPESDAPGEFLWQEAEACPVASDAHGRPIDCSALPPWGRSGLGVHVGFSTSLLYWAERKQWTWHKKWALPAITVRIQRGSNGVTSDGAPVPNIASDSTLYVLVSTGTVLEEGSELCDQGLTGECQRMIALRPHGATEVSFMRLTFQRTSFNCGGRPFHLVITILEAPGGVPPALPSCSAEAPSPAAVEGAERTAVVEVDAEAEAEAEVEAETEAETKAGKEAAPCASVASGAVPSSAECNSIAQRSPLKPLLCIRSQPIHVDARKRSKSERPQAADDDIRFIHRVRGSVLDSSVHTRAL